ncbi:MULTISPECIES: hypothetical protein [unclassified Acinetobacter]|uniref:hypothetical protein n=1 Tax=unclassified Acinetobacter TaxID=196816 RepID=UPI00190A308C|nr:MULTISPECIES: hypothetical protein [unclassified Acinetobacter]MBK0062400.1 hypothetical protein [Acinetobacter sp. S55]MBK0066204.1 hypothetical protein [Acinetobacter sp. S54]
MTITLEPYQVFLVLATIIGAVFTMVKLLGSQINANLQQSFVSTNEKIEQLSKQTNEKIDLVSKQNEKSQTELRDLERKFFQFEIDLPKNYVLRNDYIRGQTVIDAKLDAIASKLETVQIQQGMQR